MYLYAIFGFFTNVFLNVKCGLYAKGKLNTMHQLTLYKSLVSEKKYFISSLSTVFLSLQYTRFYPSTLLYSRFQPKDSVFL